MSGASKPYYQDDLVTIYHGDCREVLPQLEEHLARKPMVGYMGLTLHVPMRDEDDFEMPVEVIGRAAHLIDHTVRFGGKVIVHCTGGLNRSGVVVAEALKAGAGMNGKDAVALIRAQHDSFALCNRVFERWVTGEMLPTAETSTFRITPGQEKTLQQAAEREST